MYTTTALQSYEIGKSWHTYKLQLLAQECDSSASCSKSQEQTHHKNTEEGTNQRKHYIVLILYYDKTCQ